MKRLFIQWAALLTLGCITLVSGAYAQDDSSLTIMDQLGVSAEQKAEIKKLREQFIAETKELRNQIKGLQEEERKLKGAAKPDEDKLRTKMKERSDKEIELTLALHRFNKNLEAILTSDQRKKLEKIKAERKK